MEDMPLGSLGRIVEELESHPHSLARHFGLPYPQERPTFARGDVVVFADAALTGRSGLRYRVLDYSPETDWIHLRRIRKDGQPDRREYGFSGHANGRYVKE